MSASPLNSSPKSALRWALIASVALNLFFIGMLTASAFSERPRGFLGKALHDASPEVRAIYQELREADRDARTARWRPVYEASGRVIEAIAAEPYDQAALEAAMQAVSDARRGARGRGRLLVKMAPRLTPEQRQEVASLLAAERERRARRFQNRD